MWRSWSVIDAGMHVLGGGYDTGGERLEELVANWEDLHPIHAEMSLWSFPSALLHSLTKSVLRYSMVSVVLGDIQERPALSSNTPLKGRAVFLSSKLTSEEQGMRVGGCRWPCDWFDGSVPVWHIRQPEMLSIWKNPPLPAHLSDLSDLKLQFHCALGNSPQGYSIRNMSFHPPYCHQCLSCHC